LSESRRKKYTTKACAGWVTELLSWSVKHGKKYPFRGASDPYRVLISELLLRQTTADQVSKVYRKFFVEYPTIEALSRASVSQLSRILRPLGIKSRVHTILRVAQTIVKEYASTVPDTFEALTSLDGVGPYTAACVLTFGYGQPTPMLDVNTSRVLTRIYGLGRGTSVVGKAWSIYRDILSMDEPRHIHFAIIDLAHAVCRPTEPLCALCPCIQSCTYAGVIENTNPSKSGR
jgi:A/G-specific adenine glycosylase